MVAPSAAHPFTFHRIGGLDQVALTSATDLLALKEMDQKLWVALSCPVRGLELDERTLAIIDRDHDGLIRVPDVLATIDWAALRLGDVGALLAENDRLPLGIFRSDTAEGSAALEGARALLRRAGQPEADSVDLAGIETAAAAFARRPLNGDGVVRADSTDDPELQRLIADILACFPGVPDRNGAAGVDEETAQAFFAAAGEHLEWVQAGQNPKVLTLGPATGSAATAVAAVRAKVDDYFTRTRLAAYQPASAERLGPTTEQLAGLASEQLVAGSARISELPLATIRRGRPLPLVDGVNPAWAGALATLREQAAAPLFGAEVAELTEEQWSELKARTEPYQLWQQEKRGAAVEPLGPARLRQLLDAGRQAELLALIASDRALAPEHAALDTLEGLARLRRDFATLLRNFVNFTDFYSPDRLATFQAGTLYLDSRSLELCVEIADAGAHAKLAALSQIFLVYCDLKRADLPPRRIVACLTQGHGDYLRVGRNGIFYDRQGRDWDATITLLIENPVSLRQAFWSPYKRVARFVEEQMTKFAAAREKSADDGLAAGLADATSAERAGRQAFDVAKFAGIFAAIGLALGAIGGALASVATGFMRLSWWQMPLAVAGALLLISGPSMLLAALKLRQRTLGPVLDANGWAINGRVHINIPFGTQLTQRAELPDGAQRSLRDPYADRSATRRRVAFTLLILLLVAGLVAARLLRTWPFHG